jgi:polar amino acid transport system permease protein
MELDYQNMINSIPLFARAAWTTLWIAASGIFLAGVIGLGCAFSLYLKLPFSARPIKAYIEVSRNTPLLVQLFLLHFGLKVDTLPCAVMALAFLGGGYMAEAFRAGLEAVERSQIESALSLGLSHYDSEKGQYRIARLDQRNAGAAGQGKLRAKGIRRDLEALLWQRQPR